ncbi:uncharacterized protein [Chelonus insularis]|uniref:uncharacterized protein n=1 Tax=Chelonus insularis TaxID=460826 RepID=UPI00158CE7F8|nr:uncharacterized protein LOC118070610 [Chelonus insularis]
MIGNTEDETNNSHLNSISSLETCKRHSNKNCDKTETSFHTTLDDGDDQCWAEDEMSSGETQLHVVKRKRRHSVAHRNLKYNKRSREKHMSSSSDFSSSKNAFHKPKRPRKKKKISNNDRATTSRLSTSDSRNISIKSQRGSKFRFFSNKKK